MAHASPQLGMPAEVTWSLCGFVFAMCFKSWDPWGISQFSSVTQLAGVLLFLVCARHAGKVFAYPGSSIRVLLWIFGCTALASAINSQDVAQVCTVLVGPMLTLLQCFVLFWLGLGLFRERKTTAAALLTLASGAICMSVLMHVGIGVEAKRAGQLERVAFYGMNSNEFGFLIAVGVITTVAMVILNPANWGVWRVSLLFALPFLLKVEVESGSRGAIVAMGLGLACLGFGGLRGWTGYARLLGLLAVGGIVAHYVVTSGIMMQRMQTIIDTGDLGGRQELWRSALQMIVERPVLGWGFSGMSREFMARSNEGDPHNAVLSFFLLSGILGGVPFLLLTAGWFVRAVSRRNGEWGTLPLALLVCTLATMSKSGGIYLNPLTWLTVAFAVCQSNVVPLRTVLGLRDPLLGRSHTTGEVKTIGASAHIFMVR